MKTLMEEVYELPPMERTGFLARHIQQLKDQVREGQHAEVVNEPTDKTKVADLAAECEVSEETLLKHLKSAGGYVFKLGKAYWIRNIHLAAVYAALERAQLKKESAA